MRLVLKKRHHWLKLFALAALRVSQSPKQGDPPAALAHQILKVEPALWLFVAVDGVEPTNNAAERAIRPAVIWRRTSFGSQTQVGSTFVQRMLTVVTTLQSQRRNVLDFMTSAVSAARVGKASPSLLPKVPVTSEQVTNAA